MYLSEVLNLYSLSSDPDKLPYYDRAVEIPDLQTDPNFVTKYALQKFGGKRWPAGEKFILEAFDSDPYMALDSGMIYAQKIVKGPWPEFERILLDAETYHVRRGGRNYYFDYALKVKKGRWPEIEPRLLSMAKNARFPSYWLVPSIKYAAKVIKGRWPELEAILKTRPKYLAYYARDVIKGRWAEMEPVILRNPKSALMYIKHCIKGRWPEFERKYAAYPQWMTRYNNLIEVELGINLEYYGNMRPHAIDEALNLFNLSNNPDQLKNFDKADEIPELAWRKYYNNPEMQEKLRYIWAKDPKIAHSYATMIGQRFPEGEPAMATNEKVAFAYARFVLKGRFPLGEAAIATDGQLSFEYANEIIKGRFPEGEPAIARATLIYEYAYLIGERFKEGEKEILRTGNFFQGIRYCKAIIKGRWPEFEKILLARKTTIEYDDRQHLNYLYQYAREVVRGPWREAEDLIKQNMYLSYQYAMSVVKGPFPPGEEAIAGDSRLARQYTKQAYGKEFGFGDAAVKWLKVKAYNDSVRQNRT